MFAPKVYKYFDSIFLESREGFESFKSFESICLKSFSTPLA